MVAEQQRQQQSSSAASELEDDLEDDLQDLESEDDEPEILEPESPGKLPPLHCKMHIGHA